MDSKKKLNFIENLPPVSAERFIDSKNDQKVFELASPQANSNIFEYPVQLKDSYLDDYQELLERKMKEISEQRIQENLQFMNELKFLIIESKSNPQKKEGTFKILSLFLSFYGCWREAENLMRQLQSMEITKSNQTNQSKREVYDIYDFILELIENEYEMSLMMKCLLSQDSRIQQEQKERMDTSSQIYSFKQNIFQAIVQTFNIRMNSISDDIYQWLIDNQKLRIIEIILENDRFSASQKQTNYQMMKKQERKMLKYLHQHAILKKNYNNEIELMLNMNENNLELLSYQYILYIVKYEHIPPNYILNKTLIKQVVFQQNIPLMSAMLKLDRRITQQTLHSKRVQQQVNIFLSQPDNFCMGLYFLKKMSQKKQITNRSSDYLEQILRLLEKPKNDEKFSGEIYNHVLHPIILCLVASKILLKLSFFKNPFSSEMLKLAKFYLDKALMFRDTIFDAREMSVILFKPLFPSDKPLIKALRNSNYCSFFTEFFVHPCITYLLEQKWMSTYGFDYSLLSTFTPMCLFQKSAKLKNTIAKGSKSSSSSSSFQKSMKSTGSSGSFSLEPQKQNWIIFRDIEVSQLKRATKNNHFYQFVIYNKSVQVRTFFEFIIFIFIVGFTMYELFKFIVNLNEYASVPEQIKVMIFDNVISTEWVTQINKFKSQNPTPPPLEVDVDLNSNLNILNMDPLTSCKIILYQKSWGYPEFINYFQNDCTELIRTGVLFENLTSETIKVLWFIFCIGANAIQKQVYTYLIRGKTDPQILDLYDFLLYIACGSFLLTKQILIPNGIGGSDNYSYKYFDNCTYALKIESCIIVFILWLRLFIYLIRSQKFGLLVKVIIMFSKDLLYFMIILITVTAAFGLINYILFQSSLEIYSSIDKAIFNLFAAAFGAFDFNNQTGIQSAILIVFLVAVNVILLNLLIAILNTRYEKTMQQSEMEYSLVVYNDYINSRFNPIYMSMISLPPPFNIINLIFGIVAFFTKSRTWNKIALKIGYTLVIFLPCMIVFIAVSIVLIPISYIFLIPQVSIYAFSDNMMYARKKHRCFKISLYLFRVTTWIALGIPYLLIIFFANDLPLFCKSAFMHNSNKYSFTKNPVFDLRVIKYVSLYSNYLNLSKKDVFNYLEFRSSLESKKEVKYQKSYFSRFAQASISQPLQSIRKGNQNSVKHNFKSENIFEKNFNDAVKKFGDSKVKQEIENIQLINLLKAIKYSAIFFKKAKSTSLNLSKLLYIVKKKEMSMHLLQMNSENFFLNRSFSSQVNVNINNLN